ncbi:hypothetical protein JCM19233_3488 [Vibrio astriarenae]|nr:hypothetical protein JCM19233_3488 [Vibrio sp. C7]
MLCVQKISTWLQKPKKNAKKIKKGFIDKSQTGLLSQY